jgi:hypothetical protein
MGAAVLERQTQRPLDGVRWVREASQEPDRRSDGGVGRTSRFQVESDRVRTLDELVTDTWESLMVRAAACCPACNGRMRSCADSCGEIEGECEDCGARLC